MPLKLSVTKTDEPAAPPDSFIFHQERIIIGRDAANDLPLNDMKRVVSKQHAEMVASGATVHVTDLESKNFTYVNGDRLEAGRPCEVHPGDTIQMGDFKITFEVIEPQAEPTDAPVTYEDRTVFDTSFVNPFEEGVKLLAAALRDLSTQYDEETPQRRDDALDEALRAAMDGEEHPAYGLVAHLLRGDVVSTPEVTPPVTPPIAPVPPTTPTASSGPAGVVLESSASRLHQVVDTVLQTMAKLISGPWQFRNVFIGQTIMETEETAFLYRGDPDLLKQHTLDPALSDEEAAYRLRLLEEAIEDVGVHQVAMLDGYKASVREGALSLIDQLNPDAMEKAAAEENPLYRFLPPLAKAEALKRLRDQLQELRSEDWAAAEQRTYRPAFIKAYLARMTSVRRQEP
ncbi:MAG: FHA domain-containing protein [Rhodothermales bacterium]